MKGPCPARVLEHITLDAEDLIVPQNTHKITRKMSCGGRLSHPTCSRSVFQLPAVHPLRYYMHNLQDTPAPLHRTIQPGDGITSEGHASQSASLIKLIQRKCQNRCGNGVCTHPRQQPPGIRPRTIFRRSHQRITFCHSVKPIEGQYIDP